MLTSNFIGVLNMKGKQHFVLYTYSKNTNPKGESTHKNVQSCPYNENSEYPYMCHIAILSGADMSVHHLPAAV